MERPEQEALQDQLRQVGLNRYEASVYLGLVTDQSAKVSEISKRTGVPQPKVYQALDALVEKGFCTIGTDAVNRYRPLPPRVAIDAHIARLRQEEQAVNALAGVLEELYVEGRGKELWAPPLEVNTPSARGPRPIRLAVHPMRRRSMRVAPALWSQVSSDEFTALSTASPSRAGSTTGQLRCAR
jgi:DNA-binding MarR family transcriptional regulator